MVVSMERWVGKVAIVTGASAGIGAGIAKKLVEEGLTVVGLARRAERIEELAKSLVSAKGKLLALKCDMTVEDQILAAFKWTKENVGPVSILINNAGLIQPTNLLDGNTAMWKRILDTNILGLSIATREAIRQMREFKIDGHVVHINSISGHKNVYFPEVNMYTASKHAVTALTETLRKELNDHGLKIKITSVSPGTVTSEISRLARRKERIDELAKNLQGQKGKLYSIRCDVTKEDEILEAFKWTTENVGPVSILINNAGIFQNGNLIDGSTENWRKIFEVNVVGMDKRYEYVKELAKKLLKEGARGKLFVYKADSISPGAVETEIIQTKSGALDTKIVEALKAMPLLKTEDVAEAVMYVLSTPPHVQCLNCKSTRMKIICIIVLIFVQTSLQDLLSNFPLCSSNGICTCENNNGISANCTNLPQETLGKESTWLDQDNKNFAYKKVTVNNGIYVNLSQQFPSSNLEYLNLENNQIAILGNSVFQNLQNMTTLILSHNRINIIDPEAFKGVYKEGEYMPLRSLKTLKLDHNNINQINQDVFEHTEDLEILDLSFNPIKTFSHNTILHTLNKLTTLDLSGNPISILPATFKYGLVLERLYLNRTLLGSLNETTGFPIMPKMKLYIQNNKLSSIEAEVISSWDRLSDLDIRGNPWSCECNNQWMISTLMPIYANIVNNKTVVEEVICGSPVEMDQKHLYDLYLRNYQTRCDTTGMRPESDAVMLIGVLAGISNCC
ncbi:unnamed protein product [Brassicogethes aeneus]|uniref:Dehydrogenase/reductase SDR family member 11 n=1 Tax=Brassicogethes aeneus TaxID=1431903 RepID=A0A9P0FDI7_BRAAE|nr:unnamed protein product [Brassicogethes aeneus]